MRRSARRFAGADSDDSAGLVGTSDRGRPTSIAQQVWPLALVALACGVVVVAGVVVTNLRRQALASRATEERLLDLRQLATASDGLAWETSCVNP